MDRINGVAYVDISERADLALAERWASELGYKDLVTFRCCLFNFFIEGTVMLIKSRRAIC